MAIQPEAWRFFDPTLGVPDPAAPPARPTAMYQLDRRVRDGAECFALLAPFAYLDRVTGLGVVTPYDLPIGIELVDDTVGAALDTSLDTTLDSDSAAGLDAVAGATGSAFRSDLTSVPDLFTWLVPKTGAHLPAALVHDSMIGDPEYRLVRATNGRLADGFRPARPVWDPGDDEPSPLTAVDADRIFRDAMADSGTGVIRRWLVWTAVSLRTILARDGTSEVAWRRWSYALVAGAALLAITWLGYQATAQIMGWTGRWPCTYELPWITSELPGSLGDLPLIGDGIWARITSGVAVAVVFPVSAGFLWGKFRAAGMIAGIALAVLFHITIALIVLSAVYVVAEAVVSGGVAGVATLPPERRSLLRRSIAFARGAGGGVAGIVPRTRDAAVIAAIAAGVLGAIVVVCLLFS